MEDVEVGYYISTVVEVHQEVSKNAAEDSIAGVNVGKDKVGKSSVVD